MTTPTSTPAAPQPETEGMTEGLDRILGREGKINALVGLLRDVRDVLAYEADAFDSSRCGDMAATIDEFMGWTAAKGGR